MSIYSISEDFFPFQGSRERRPGHAETVVEGSEVFRDEERPVKE
jgi:hypothetical protein